MSSEQIRARQRQAFRLKRRGMPIEEIRRTLGFTSRAGVHHAALAGRRQEIDRRREQLRKDAE